MWNKAVQGYYKFFDETLGSTTLIVLIITLLIFCVWSVIPSVNADGMYMKGSILEASEVKKMTNRVTIDGVEYEIIFSKVK